MPRNRKLVLLIVPLLVFMLACQTLNTAQSAAGTAQALGTQAVQMATQAIQLATQAVPMETAFAQSTPEPGATEAPAGAPTSSGDLFDPKDPPVSTWKEIPVMPQAVAGQEMDSVYVYRVNATVKDVQDFYAAQLPPLGWTNLYGGSSDLPFVVYTKGNQTATITVTEQTNGTIVLLTVE